MAYGRLLIYILLHCFRAYAYYYPKLELFGSCVAVFNMLDALPVTK